MLRDLWLAYLVYVLAYANYNGVSDVFMNTLHLNVDRSTEIFEEICIIPDDSRRAPVGCCEQDDA